MLELIISSTSSKASSGTPYRPEEKTQYGLVRGEESEFELIRSISRHVRVDYIIDIINSIVCNSLPSGGKKHNVDSSKERKVNLNSSDRPPDRRWFTIILRIQSLWRKSSSSVDHLLVGGHKTTTTFVLIWILKRVLDGLFLCTLAQKDTKVRRSTFCWLEVIKQRRRGDQPAAVG